MILSYRVLFSSLLVLSLSMLLVNSAWSDDKLSGPDVVKAADVAYTRFAGELTTRYSGQTVSEETEELLNFMVNPRNYDMGISQTNDLYIVVFLPRRAPPFENVVGGGGEYHIRKSDLTVIKSAGYK